MIRAWMITRTVSPMPPSFRFVPDVTLIGLSSRQTACPPRRLCSGWPPGKQSTGGIASCNQLPELVFLPSIFGDPTRYRLGGDNDDGLRGRTFVCQRNIDSGFATDRRNRAQPHERAAGELHRRATA